MTPRPTPMSTVPVARSPTPPHPDTLIAHHFIDVAPECLALFAQSLPPTVRVIGTAQRDDMTCRFILAIPAFYEQPPCQWTLETTVEGLSVKSVLKPVWT